MGRHLRKVEPTFAGRTAMAEQDRVQHHGKTRKKNYTTDSPLNTILFFPVFCVY